MIFRKNNQIKSSLFVFFAMITFPFYLFAQESKKPVEHEAGFYYTIQKGDTLWGLSRRFYDSSWLWPDLWRENSQISNPHFLEPGERIRLFHQKKTERFVKPGLKQSLTEKAPYKEPIYFFYKEINKVGFIRKKTVTPRGTIFKVKGDKGMISRGDIVYIKQTEKTQLSPETRYTVYRPLKPIKDLKTRTDIGTQHYILGIAEIIKQEPRFAIARIIRSFREIKINDRLMPYRPRSSKIIVAQSKQEINGKIIAPEEDTAMIGSGVIAFIDKGKKDGITPGQSYSILSQGGKQSEFKKKEKILLPPDNIGSLVVLHTEQTTSTVLVTRSNKEFFPGARIGLSKP